MKNLLRANHHFLGQIVEADDCEAVVELWSEHGL